MEQRRPTPFELLFFPLGLPPRPLMPLDELRIEVPSATRVAVSPAYCDDMCILLSPMFRMILKPTAL